MTALFPVVATVLYVSADPAPRWTAEAIERAQAEAERTVRLSPALWTDDALTDDPWVTRRRVTRDGLLVTATVEVWREGGGRGGTEGAPLVSLLVARLNVPSGPAP